MNKACIAERKQFYFEEKKIVQCNKIVLPQILKDKETEASRSSIN